MAASMAPSSSSKVHILNLPAELRDKIINYLSFEEISHLRLVCKSFDKTCQSLLNNGFKGVDKFHGKCLRKVKAQLPRRESERRSHPLARHCDILNAIETRLSLLNMTFIKYVDLHLCCFIPGKVIDEIYRVLRLIKSPNTPPRAHEILQELRDISSMAMEHFDDKIVPTLKQKLAATQNNPASTRSSCSFQELRGMSTRNNVIQLQQACKQNSDCLKSLRKELKLSKHKINQNERKISEQGKTIMELNHTITDLNAKISEQDGRVLELSRKLTEGDGRLPTVFTEVTKAKTPRPDKRPADKTVIEEDFTYKKKLRSFSKTAHPLPRETGLPKKRKTGVSA